MSSSCRSWIPSHLFKMEEIQSTAGAIPVRNEKGNNTNLITYIMMSNDVSCTVSNLIFMVS